MRSEDAPAEDIVIVVAGGGPASAALLPQARAVIAADGGLERALALGLRVDVAIGDFDSVSSEAMVAAKAAGATFVRHAPAKDATDLELALEHAATLKPRRILLIGAEGGRLDHLLASLLALGSERFAEFELDAILGAASIHVVRRERRLTGRAGELITLLALNGPAKGVVTEGLLYPLGGETLEPGSTRGVSNVFTQAQARVQLAHGVLLAIRPGAEEIESARLLGG
jgi:thiamine pyrophosphokinase